MAWRFHVGGGLVCAEGCGSLTAMKRLAWAVLLAIFVATQASATDRAELKERRQRAAKAFADDVLLLHSRATIEYEADGYREDPVFYYLTGLENAQPAVLAIDGKNRESWLFVAEAKLYGGTVPTWGVKRGADAAEQLGFDHVVDWTELEKFLATRAENGGKVYYSRGEAQLPPNLSAGKNDREPSWVQLLQQRWPKLDFQPVGTKLFTLMAVQSRSEQQTLRKAAAATVQAVMAGMGAIRPGVSQRSVELAVVNACWNAGARGVSFWPWAMAGENSVFPKPFESMFRYDHLDSTMKAGDLVRLDVGCEWEHYQGDLGRTVPVSGKYTEEQREIWTIFVAAYQAGVKQLKEGNTEDQVFEAWKQELLRQRPNAKSALAKQAIETWSERKNVPYWQAHTMNLDAGFIDGAMRAGMTINFEPIAAIGGQGYYLEDMFLITKDGAEKLTPGVPYGAEEIEKAMK
jgi:Xaa-Pro aminopeptidase